MKELNAYLKRVYSKEREENEIKILEKKLLDPKFVEALSNWGKQMKDMREGKITKRYAPIKLEGKKRAPD